MHEIDILLLLSRYKPVPNCLQILLFLHADFPEYEHSLELSKNFKTAICNEKRNMPLVHNIYAKVGTDCIMSYATVKLPMCPLKSLLHSTT